MRQKHQNPSIPEGTEKNFDAPWNYSFPFFKEKRKKEPQKSALWMLVASTIVARVRPRASKGITACRPTKKKKKQIFFFWLFESSPAKSYLSIPLPNPRFSLRHRLYLKPFFFFFLDWQKGKKKKTYHHLVCELHPWKKKIFSLGFGCGLLKFLHCFYHTQVITLAIELCFHTDLVSENFNRVSPQFDGIATFFFFLKKKSY